MVLQSTKSCSRSIGSVLITGKRTKSAPACHHSRSQRRRKPAAAAIFLGLLQRYIGLWPWGESNAGLVKPAWSTNELRVE